MLIHSHQTATVVLAVVIFTFGQLGEKRWVPLTRQSGAARCTGACRLPGATARLGTSSLTFPLSAVCIFFQIGLGGDRPVFSQGASL